MLVVFITTGADSLLSFKCLLNSKLKVAHSVSKLTNFHSLLQVDYII